MNQGEVKITQVRPNSIAFSSDLRGKWYASRLTGETTFVDMDFGEDMDLMGEPVPLIDRIETVEYPRHEYLHPDGVWKDSAYYFATQSELMISLDKATVPPVSVLVRMTAS